MNWHLITCEYPPQFGGVSDYCQLVAEGLAAAGEEVQVWSPPGPEVPSVPHVRVRRELGNLRPAALRLAGRLMDREPSPRLLLVQWVPHGYGMRSMNVPFCWWILRRSWTGDHVELMIHEASLDIAGNLRQHAAAFVHRVMLSLLLKAATAVWLAIPAWENRCRPYLFGRKVPFTWLPIPSTIPLSGNAGEIAAIRQRYAPGTALVGRFGNHGPEVDCVLQPLLLHLLTQRPDVTALLIGGESSAFRDLFVAGHPELARRLAASGRLAAIDVSHHLAACDVLLQPLPEGVTTRSTTVMAGISHGKPLVTTASTLTEPLWRDCAGVCLAAAHPAIATEAIGRLLDDPDLRRQAGAAAAALYARLFDLRHTIDRLRAGPVNCG